MVQDEMQKIVDASKFRLFSQDKAEYEKVLDRLQTLKNTYKLLWDVSFEINEVFTWSITANLIQNFVQTGCDLYWCWISFAQKTIEYPIYCSIILPPVLLISLVLFEANRVKVEALKIPVQIHDISKCKREVELYNMVSELTVDV
jgi:hypothetical protein